MAIEVTHAVPGAPANPANKSAPLTPIELAEFIDSLEYDEAPATVADTVDCDPEQ